MSGKRKIKLINNISLPSFLRKKIGIKKCNITTTTTTTTQTKTTFCDRSNNSQKKKNKINNANIDSIQNVVRVFTRLNNSAIVGRRTSDSPSERVSRVWVKYANAARSKCIITTPLALSLPHLITTPLNSSHFMSVVSSV